MKIKTKKQMTPEEYAKHMIDKHGIRGYESEMIDSNIIGAPNRFTQVFELNTISKEDLPRGSFGNGKITVEVEEEITENTVLEKTIETYTDDDFGWTAVSWREKSIKYILTTNQYDTRTETIHLVNDDGTHTLIWTHEKGLVE